MSSPAAPPPAYTESSWALLAGARFVLAAIVFLTHLGIFSATMPAALSATLEALNSRAAVIGFLLISGFSIGASYRQRAEGYYARRFLRIYPLYFFAVALAQALVVLVGSPYPVAHYTFTAAGWKTALGNFLLLQGFAVIPLPYNVALWTLSIEVFFYLWAPLLAKTRPAVMIGLIVASMAVFAWRTSLPLYGENAAHLAWPWLTGFLLAYRGWTAITVTLTVAGSFLPLLRPDKVGGSLCWFTVGATVAVLWAAPRVSLPGRARTVLDSLGQLSYPLYLFHLPLGLAFYHYAGLRGYWPLVVAVLLAVPVVDLVCDHWLKAVFWKPLVARLTGLGPVKITSAAATNP